jgi:hypothetical protein
MQALLLGSGLRRQHTACHLQQPQLDCSCKGLTGNQVSAASQVKLACNQILQQGLQQCGWRQCSSYPTSQLYNMNCRNNSFI